MAVDTPDDRPDAPVAIDPHVGEKDLRMGHRRLRDGLR